MDKNTLLHRQIHPSWVQNDVVSTQAFQGEIVASISFVPSEKDKDHLSVFNGEKFTAEKSFDFHTKQHPSAGVLSVTVDECESPLQVIADDNPFDGHASIDFSALPSKGQKKKMGSALRDAAVKRQWTHHP